jgi:hypothetical protein
MKSLAIVGIVLFLFTGKCVAQNSGSALSTAELKERMGLNAPQLYQKYKSASRLSGVGTGLTLGGAALMVVGIATADKETERSDARVEVRLSGAGGAVFVVGLLSACAGTPLWIIGSSKKRNARNAYLRQFGDSAYAPKPSPSLYLQVRPSSNGAGLAVIF